MDTEATVDTIGDAGRQDIGLLAFPEALLPGYPFWICRTNGAAWDDPRQNKVRLILVLSGPTFENKKGGTKAAFP